MSAGDLDTLSALDAATGDGAAAAEPDPVAVKALLAKVKKVGAVMKRARAKGRAGGGGPPCS